MERGGFGEQGLGIGAGANPQGWGTLTRETLKLGESRSQAAPGGPGELGGRRLAGGRGEVGTERGHQRRGYRKDGTSQCGFPGMERLWLERETGRSV